MTRLSQMSFAHEIADAVRAETSTCTTLGFAAGTRILTLDGELPVEHLCEGDRIITRSGVRILRRISSHVSRDSYTVRPNTLGNARPEEQITIGRDQLLLVRDWRAMALYDAEEVLVPAARIADGEYIAPFPKAVRMYQIGFDQDEVVYAGGVEALAPAN